MPDGGDDEPSGSSPFDTTLARYAANVFRYSTFAASVLRLYPSLCSGGRTSHMLATIVDTSPNDAFGFCALMAACVSRKNSAYALTGFCGSFGSFFFFLRDGFGLAAPAAVAVVLGAPDLPAVDAADPLGEALGNMAADGFDCFIIPLWISGSGEGRFRLPTPPLASLSSLVVPPPLPFGSVKALCGDWLT